MQVDHSLPGMRVITVTVLILSVVFRMLTRPAMIPCRMIGDHVDDHLHTQFMRRTHQLFKILQLAKFRIDSRIIAASIIAPQAALTPLLTDGSNGHEPEDV